MKNKNLLLLAICFAFATSLLGQNTFNKGDKVLNLGIGLGSTLYTGGYYSSSIPPLSISFESCVKDNLFDAKSSIGIGGYLGYDTYKWEYSGYGWKYSSVILGVRGSFHYQLLDKTDTYAGILLGYDIVNSKEFGTHTPGGYVSTSNSQLVYSTYIGAKYYFTPNIGAFAELGYGISILNLGIGFKF